MANKVQVNTGYFPLTSKGKPISNGQVYVGKIDTDPTLPVNQLQMSVQQEDGTIVNIPQPALLGAGGVPEYNGSPVTLLVDGNYSVTVLDVHGSQIYHVPSIVGGGILTTDGKISIGAYGDNLSVAIAGIGSDEITLLIDTTVTLIQNDTVPDNITLEKTRAGMFTGAFTLTINGGMTGDLMSQWFDSSVTVTGSPKITEVYPEMFGAIGDGVTDDTIAIQSAIDLSTVKLTNAIYVISGININNSIYSDVFSQLKSNSISARFIDILASNVTLRGIDFYQNLNSSGISIYAEFSDINNITIADCYIHQNIATANSGHNIVVKALGDFDIADVSIINTKAYWSYGDGTTSGDNLYIASYSTDGLGTVTKVNVSGCSFDRASRQNISVAGSDDSNKPMYISITDNKLFNATLAGIDLEEAGYVSIANNTIKNAGQYTAGGVNSPSHITITAPSSIMRSGISLHNVNNSTVIGGSFINCYYLASGNAALVITGSYIEDSGILLGSAASGPNLQLSNCKIKLTASYPHTRFAQFNNANFTMNHCIFEKDSSLVLTSIFYTNASDAATGILKYTKISNSTFQLSNIDTFMQQAFSSVTISRCEFYNAGTVVVPDSINRFASLIVRDSKFYACDDIIKHNVRARDSLEFTGNSIFDLHGYAIATNQEQSIIIDNNIFRSLYTNGDGLVHAVIYAYNGIGGGSISNNLFFNSGTATDSLAIYYRAKNTERVNTGIDISFNRTESYSQGLLLQTYSGPTNITNSIAMGNKAINNTSADSFAGFTADASNTVTFNK